MTIEEALQSTETTIKIDEDFDIETISGSVFYGKTLLFVGITIGKIIFIDIEDWNINISIRACKINELFIDRCSQKENTKNKLEIIETDIEDIRINLSAQLPIRVTSGEKEGKNIFGKLYLSVKGKSSVYFSNINFQKAVQISGECPVYGIIAFNNCTFQDVVNVLSLLTWYIQFTNSSFENILAFENVDRIKFIKIFNVVFNKRVTISQSKHICNLDFESCKFNDVVQIELDRTSMQEWRESTATFLFRNIEVRKEFIVNSWGQIAACLLIINNQASQGIINILNTSFHAVAISQHLIGGGIRIDNSQIGCLIFSYFSNFGELYLSNIKAFKEANTTYMSNIDKYFYTLLNFYIKKKEIYIIMENSNVGKAHLSNFNFASFDKIYIANSSLGEITFNNIDWFQDDQLEVKELQERKEIYRQLKKANDREGDKEQSLIFKAFEYDTYRQLLIKNRSRENWPDRFILNVNRLTNNYGTSWKRALQWILIITAGFYIPFVIETSKEVIWCPDFSWEGFTRTSKVIFSNWGLYFELLNPVRKFDFNLSNLGILINFLQRVVLYILIFQLIAAFRKFSK